MKWVNNNNNNVKNFVKFEIVCKIFPTLNRIQKFNKITDI